MSSSYANCKLCLQSEDASRHQPGAFRRPDDRQFALDGIFDSLRAKKIRRVDDAVARSVAKLEQISPGRCVAHRQDEKVVLATQQDDRLETWKITVIDLAAQVEPAPLQGDSRGSSH